VPSRRVPPSKRTTRTRTTGIASRAGSSPREPARLKSALAGADPALSLTIDGHAIGLTHLDRIYWPAEPGLGQPAITKRDYLRYLIDVAPMMLPHVTDRPLTLFRWPEGIEGRRVLMKHWEIRLPEFVERVDILSESKGHADQYLLCNNLATLVWLGHMGTLEFHAWHSRVRPGADTPISSVDFTSSRTALRASIVEHPDYLLFDLDPFLYSGREARGRHPSFNQAGFDRCREVALLLKAVLDAMDLTSFVKTSGKTGLHVVVPIRRTLRYDAVRGVARYIGDHLMRAHAEAITVDWSVDKRTGKVFIDYNMNVRGKSMTVPYSPRGLAGAPVSMPITWRALARAGPPDYRITTVAAITRKQPDAWAAVRKSKQSLEKRLSASAAT
jgi:bifunctional non-homologous end joining protein LigD